MTDLLIRDTDRRLAGVLMRVSGAEPPPYYPGYCPIAEELAHWSDPSGVPLTQALLADLANASPHTVARFIDRASAAGMIDWRYGRVRILDVPRPGMRPEALEVAHAPPAVIIRQA